MGVVLYLLFSYKKSSHCTSECMPLYMIHYAGLDDQLLMLSELVANIKQLSECSAVALLNLFIFSFYRLWAACKTKKPNKARTERQKMLAKHARRCGRGQKGELAPLKKHHLT